MPAATKVIIAGGGIGGLSTALACVRRGLEPTVLEQRDSIGGGGSGFSIWAYAVKALLDNGVSEDAIAAAGSPYVATDIYNGKGEHMATMPIEEISQEFGASSFDMDRIALMHAMADALPDGVVRTGSRVTGIEQESDGAVAVLEDGTRVDGDVVVVAEGIHARHREQVAGPAELGYSGFTGSGGIVDTAPEGAEPGHHTEIWSKGAKGGLATVQSGGARWYIVHQCEPGTTPEKDELVAEAHRWYEPLARAIEATPAEEIQSHEAWDLGPLPTWHDGRTILIGDAAHATTPYAAMGACMAIVDGDVLAEVIAASETVEEAFTAMEERRKKATEATVAGARKTASWAMMDSALGAWIRDLEMKHLPDKKAREIAAEMAGGGVSEGGLAS